jgi:phospholipase C
VAPYSACEHPSATPAAGENLTARLIAALASNPDVWAKTALILNYDENDGFFDHVPPLVPPTGGAPGKSTVALDGELYHGVPVGLGPRVPMIVVSPWTKGGWVNSQLFDHTSVIRLLEARFGVAEPQITPWRRAVTGDLTSVFDFDAPDRSPHAALPDAAGLPARARAQANLPAPHPPPTPAPLPRQEPGTRPALDLTLANLGAAGAGFVVYPAQADAGGPWFYAVEAGRTLRDRLPVGDAGYDFTLHGPNGFLRRFRGDRAAGLVVACRYERADATLRIALRNQGQGPVSIRTANAYSSGDVRVHSLSPGAEFEDAWAIAPAAHWYDIAVTADADRRFLRRLAGHIETGGPSRSDPALAWPPT